MPNEYATGLAPEPNDVSDALLAGTRVPKLSLHVPGFTVEYRKCPNVGSPFGLAEPFSVAELEVMAVAAEVVAVGAACVVKVSIVPNAVPSALEAMAQKK